MGDTQTMTSSAFAEVDLRHLPGRILAVGDVHGRFDLLEEELSRLSYDAERDRIVLLGDLVNRGPYSGQVHRWWNELRVLGNHERMVGWYVQGLSDRLPGRTCASWLDGIGGYARTEVADRLLDAPAAMEISTPRGRRVGFVHAQVPSVPGHDWRRLGEMLRDGTDPFHEQAVVHAAGTRYDWQVARLVLSDERHADHDNACEQALWARTQVTLARMGYDAPGVDGIDHVFFGHTRTTDPLVHRNCSWIDTGAYATGRLTVVDVDAWLDDVAERRRRG
jgi:serine/threonine protein phosphatase 1